MCWNRSTGGVSFGKLAVLDDVATPKTISNNPNADLISHSDFVARRLATYSALFGKICPNNLLPSLALKVGICHAFRRIQSVNSLGKSRW